METKNRPGTQPLLKVPDPVVIKNSHPCKGMLIFESYILLGLDSGEIKTYDKKTFDYLSEILVILLIFK